MNRQPPMLSVIVAEPAPIIAAGLVHCLRALQQPRCSVVEAQSADDIRRMVSEMPSPILIVNPNFGGVFDPQTVRDAAPESLKIIAVESGPLAHSTRTLYDATLPIADDMQGIADRLEKLSAAPSADNDYKEALSNREKEIVTLVVKGLTNKEIAEQLFLSVHTVVTHRRNIARKLEIHSATGLTIYAIVNGLVDLADLHL